MGSAIVDASSLEMEAAGWISYPHWVQDALALMRNGAPGKIGLFESSVPEPSAMLADTVSAAFRNGPPATYQSVFMRNNPDLALRLGERYGAAAEQIICTTGATSAVQLIYAGLLNRDDHILIERPGFDMFANYALDAEIEIGFFDRPAPDFSLSVDAVLSALTAKTRMVVVTNLHNPSGALVSDETLSELADALRERGVYLLIDEVYRDYYDAEPCRFDVSRHWNAIRVNSMTKIFGLSSVRCGWMIASGRTLEQLKAYRDRVDFAVSKLSHSIAAEVFARAHDFDRWRTGHMDAAMPVAESAFSELSAAELVELSMPLQGCVCFARVVGVEDTVALSRWLIASHGVVVVPGECFGMAGHIRIGYALDESRLSAGLDRLSSGLKEYRKQNAKSQRIA
ncbi:pyridoxal phosphate-dependent aminotransferase [Henriciella mobilis]|uniref:Pyridoxal phosphate-dependent aminotransferase n=1 Tax=Henriciella mobilis TaxID=2305467 RepID=A0A399RSL5_9PROT|nr:pyridoxal phosphate-dependent aminotransferase [Henriciella mobilis]RIJ33019.1 pyridoxal phosphate-dependent aminotransferase [Henriciella mobilis]